MAPETRGESQGGLLAQAQHYWHVLLKWKWIVALFFLVSVAAATIYSFMVRPVYTASGILWIEDDPHIMPFEDVQTLGAGGNLSSHARILQSRTLASDTIDKLKLYENPDFTGMPKKGEKPPDPTDPIFRETLVRDFLDCVSVSSNERSRLVDVRFSSRSPKLAAEVLNALFEGYKAIIIKKRYSASELATEFLSTQIGELRTQIDKMERDLGKYGSERDILPLSTAEAPTVARIGEINNALTAAKLDRVNKYNAYNQLQSAPLGEIPNAPEGSLIQRLREQYINLSREYSTRLTTVRPEFPTMQRLKSELDSVTEALKNETRNLIRISYSDYQAALDKERSLQSLLDTQKNEAYKANSNSVVYNSMKIELENKKTLLEALSKRQSETDASSGLKGLEALKVWVVDKADFPLKPAFPNKPKNILIGILMGLIGGVGLAFGLEYLDHTVKTSKDVANAIGVPTLGSIPSLDAETRSSGPKAEFEKLISMLKSKSAGPEARPRRKKKGDGASSLEPRWLSSGQRNGKSPAAKMELIAFLEPHSIQAESYRSIRTTLLISSPPGRIKTILFTSPLAREGKSSTVSNLGITLAEAGRRVVIVDSDLRKPRQARIHGIGSGKGPGLSDYLSANIELEEIIKSTEITNLHLIPSGPLPADPIERLTSEKMDTLVASLKRSFDFVLFDAPPLLAVSDALAMGPMADAIVLVARGGQTPIQAIKQAKQKLDAHKLKCLGVILTCVDLVEQDGYYAKQYYQYSRTE
jgi:succinoglycan biosynthesis transport protein ExoP